MDLQGVAAGDEGVGETLGPGDRRRIARGDVRIDEPNNSPTFKVLFEQFSDGLTNRNAQDDRSRGQRHVVPKFGRARLTDVSLATVMSGSTSNERPASSASRRSGTT